jgi:hypothetical protein
MYYYPLTEPSDARTGAWVPSKIKSFIADFVRSTVRECVTRVLLASEPLITAFAEIIHESERGSCVASNDDASGSAYGVKTRETLVQSQGAWCCAAILAFTYDTFKTIS